jgi:hypothetical protein
MKMLGRWNELNDPMLGLLTKQGDRFERVYIYWLQYRLVLKEKQMDNFFNAKKWIRMYTTVPLVCAEEERR